MTLSIGSGPDDRHEQELTNLRRRVVADGYSSAHSCQHCNKLAIVSYSADEVKLVKHSSWPEWLCKMVYGISDKPRVVASEEEVKQRAAAGCRLWSLVSEKVDEEITLRMKHNRDRLAVDTPRSVALSNNEVQNLRSGCLSNCTQYASPHTRRTSAEARGYDVHFICGSGDPAWPAAHLPLEIRAFENGIVCSIQVRFTVFELPHGPQISNNHCGFAWPVNVDPGSAQSFELMRTWIQKCALEHGCGISDHSPYSMPTMLLSVDSVDQCGSIRLVQLTPGEKHQYLALSYCWGPSAQRKTLTRTTRTEFTGDGIRLEELDATIQDAVKVTRELGYLYLWIDALCIIQDDEDFKAGEMSRMDEIYDNASITIVAARASSVSEGFLTRRQPAGASSPDRVFQVAYKRLDEQPNTIDDRVILVPDEQEHWETPKEPWESRAWTMQEDLLSKRQLRFGAKQTSWVCYCSHKPYKDFDGWFGPGLQEVRARRFLDNPLQRLGRILQQPDLVESVDEARRTWYRLVGIYSQRTLSFRDDRLPAISAIARRMAPILGDEYCCGIWKSNTPWELQWRPRRAPYATGVREASIHERGRPSWTWASQRGTVSFPSTSSSMARVDVHFEVVELVAGYKSPENIYGAVTVAQLRVRGLVTTAPFKVQDCLTLRPRSTKQRQHEQGETRRSGMGSDRALKLREIFLDKGVVRLDRSLNDELADPSRDIQNKQIVLLLVSYEYVDPNKRPTPFQTVGLLLLNESDNRFSRLGIFHVGHFRPDESDYYGGDFSTEDGYMQTFLEFWGGKESIQEIVLV